MNDLQGFFPTFKGSMVTCGDWEGSSLGTKKRRDCGTKEMQINGNSAGAQRQEMAEAVIDRVHWFTDAYNTLGLEAGADYGPTFILCLSGR